MNQEAGDVKLHSSVDWTSVKLSYVSLERCSRDEASGSVLYLTYQLVRHSEQYRVAVVQTAYLHQSHAQLLNMSQVYDNDRLAVAYSVYHSSA